MDNEDRFIGCCSNRGTGIEVREFRAKGVNLDSLEVLGRSEVSTRDGKGVHCVDEEPWGPISSKETLDSEIHRAAVALIKQRPEEPKL